MAPNAGISGLSRLRIEQQKFSAPLVLSLGAPGFF
jgi:hypothetical protein